LHFSKNKIGIAQIGTKHGHASSVLSTILNNPSVNFKGLYEPDLLRRKELKRSNIFPWNKINFFEHESLLYSDDISAIASEGANVESLNQTLRILEKGKHVFYDKPAGDNFEIFKQCIDIARKKNLHLQMGYMFRNHNGFRLLNEITKSGRIGNIFSIRAHMSTYIQEPMRKQISAHKGGILFDLGGHMIDQLVYLMGRPKLISSFIRKDITKTPNFYDNCISVYQFDNSIAIIDISSAEVQPAARRFEIYGTEGSLIMEPFEPAQTIRAIIPKEKPNEFFITTKDYISSFGSNDTARYIEGFDNFIRVISGESKPNRTLDHELLVQETLLRSVELL